MPAQIINKPVKMPIAGRQPKPGIFALFIVAGLVTIAALLLIFPNLTGNPAYFALAAITTLFSFSALGLKFSGLRAALPPPVRIGISALLWLFVALDVIFLLLPNFIGGSTANEADPFAASSGAAANVTAAGSATIGFNLPGLNAARTTVASLLAAPTASPDVPTAAGTNTSTAISINTSAATAATAAVTTAAAPTAAITAANTSPARTAGPPATTTTSNTPAAKTTTAAAVVAPPVAGPRSGDFKGAGNYKVTGKAMLGKTPDGKSILRFDNLNSSNGPDLVVYLSRESNPTSLSQIKNGIQLTRLKATQGSSNYEVDPKLDLNQFKSAVIWCEAFSVLFGSANLN